jgi:hypothetical protein
MLFRGGICGTVASISQKLSVKIVLRSATVGSKSSRRSLPGETPYPEA